MPSPLKPPSQLPDFPEDPSLGQVDTNGDTLLSTLSHPSLWDLLHELWPVLGNVSSTFLCRGLEGLEDSSPDPTPVWLSHRK